MKGLRVVPRRCTPSHLRIVGASDHHILFAWDLDDKHRLPRLRVEVGLLRRKLWLVDSALDAACRDLART